MQRWLASLLGWLARLAGWLGGSAWLGWLQLVGCCWLAAAVSSPTRSTLQEVGGLNGYIPVRTAAAALFLNSKTSRYPDTQISKIPKYLGSH